MLHLFYGNLMEICRWQGIVRSRFVDRADVSLAEVLL
jgi:hypothetical protein